MELEDVEFLTKLKNLLKEYNCAIDFVADSCSDWHGMYDYGMEISKSTGKGWQTETILRIDGDGFGADDIQV